MQTNIKRIAYTSDGKRRQSQVTLRNLLSDNLLQNNFTSLQSERIFSSVRPEKSIFIAQKDYNDRIRKKLYPQTAMRSKKSIDLRLLPPHEQNRLTRNKTENIRQMIHHENISSKEKQHSSSKPLFVSKEHKNKMKKIVGKINLLARGQLRLQEEEEIDTIFEFLQSLAINENFYQEGFRYLTEKLRNIIFMSLETCNSETIVDFRKVTEITSNKQIIASIYGSQSEKTTYKDLIRQYVKEVIIIAERAEQQTEKARSKTQQYAEYLRQKQELIKKLSQKLLFYQSHPSQNKYPQLMQLKQQNNALRAQIQEQIYKNRVIQHNLELLHETKLMNENRIDELKREIAKYQLEKQSNLNKVEKSSELKMFEDNVTMLKQMLDRSIIRMGGMKEEYEKLKNCNQTLVQQRDNLAKRAAVGFGQLTPRPNLKKIFENYNMNFNEVFNVQEDKPSSSTKKSDNKQISTQKFVDTLIGKFKNYYDTYKVQQKQRQATIELANPKKNKKNQKQKQQDVFDTMFNEVQQAKLQIKKTMVSVEEVKAAYNKKQEELLKK